jgi:hypothetical protein
MAKKIKRTTVSASSTSKVAEFNPDYSHVKSDLSRIALLAGSFLVVLIALSFFIK